MQFGSVALGALGASAAFALYRYYCSASTPRSLALTYFDIAAAPGEKVRLTFKLLGIPFTDNRIKFPDWAALKPKTKYGQMPFLEADGEELYQSGALLRWIGQMGSGSLYPAATDPVLCRKIEEMLGVGDDLQREWSPALYMGMGRHTSYGHPQEWAGKDACVKEMREKFVAEGLPKYMAFLSTELEKSGGFLCGPKPTIADCQLIPQVVYFTKGVADHVPKDCLSKYPVVLAWIARFKALPQLAGHYA